MAGYETGLDIVSGITGRRESGSEKTLSGLALILEMLSGGAGAGWEAGQLLKALS